MFSPLVHRLQDLCTPNTVATPSRRWSRLTPALLIDALPSLGNVLYMPMQACGPTAAGTPRGLLVETIQLAPLLQVRWLLSASMITVEGPREWIECVGRDGRSCARLHLLPDTDYLAWDTLLARVEPAPASQLSSRHSRPAAALLLHFHLRRLAALDVLGCEIATRVSPLGRRVAAQIARAEVLSWQPHMDD